MAAALLLARVRRRDHQDRRGHLRGGVLQHAASSSSAAATGAAVADTPFCQQLTTSFAELTPAFTGGASDPASLGAALQKAAALSARHPAARRDRAPTGRRSATALDADRASYGERSTPHDPASATAFLAQNQAQLGGAGDRRQRRVGTYLSTKCGIAAPTDLPDGAQSS